MSQTCALFKGCKIPKREPDYISESGSKYWYGENKKGGYVIRSSNHWVKQKNIHSNKIIIDFKNISSCIWHIKTTTELNKDGFYRNVITGKSYFKDFKSL